MLGKTNTGTVIIAFLSISKVNYYMENPGTNTSSEIRQRLNNTQETVDEPLVNVSKF